VRPECISAKRISERASVLQINPNLFRFIYQNRTFLGVIIYVPNIQSSYHLGEPKKGEWYMMEDIERTRVMKELTRLLQNSTGEVESEGELDGRVEAIKRELGAWFIEGYPLYQAS